MMATNRPRGSLLILGAEVNGRTGLDIKIVDGTIVEIGRRLASPHRTATIIEARGSAVVAGLWDHHIHLPALAVVERSLRLGPPQVNNYDQLEGAVRAATPDPSGWLRGIGYHEGVAGELDAATLDTIRSDVAIRVQHRSGGLWIFNSRALRELAEAGSNDGVDRDSGHGPDHRGQLLRNDRWLARRLQAQRQRQGAPAMATSSPEYVGLSASLSRLGVVGCTEATPDLDLATARRLESTMDQRLVFLSSAAWTSSQASGECCWPGSTSRLGPAKIMVTEDSLPDLDALSAAISGAHQGGRPVAIHVVSRVAMALVVAAFNDVGVRPGDRIEHASVTPPGLASQLAALGVTVVTQPNFIAERGDQYRQDVELEDQPWLYRLQGHIDAGVPLAGGTDAPFGEPNPWAAMQAAVTRATATGQQMGRGEALHPEAALALFTTDPLAPGGRPRHVGVAAAADLCLIDRPWAQARVDLAAVQVRATIAAGRSIFIDESTQPG